MTHNATADLVAAHRQATRALLQAGMAHLKADHPEEHRIAVEAAQHGAHFLVSSALSPAGLDELLIDLVTPDGQRINLMHVENESTGLFK